MSSNVKKIFLGSQPLDDGQLVLSKDEKDNLVKKYPNLKKWIRPYMMGKDFINRQPRYCLWLVGLDPKSVRSNTEIIKRIQHVKEFREQSKRRSTQKAAQIPSLFAERNYSDSNYIFCAMLYVLKNGCTWRDLPADYPKWSTVYYYWMSWSKAPTPDKPALLTQVLKKLSLIDD